VQKPVRAEMMETVLVEIWRISETLMIELNLAEDFKVRTGVSMRFEHFLNGEVIGQSPGELCDRSNRDRGDRL
jgi:hypothetical protein